MGKKSLEISFLLVPLQEVPKTERKEKKCFAKLGLKIAS